LFLGSYSTYREGESFSNELYDDEVIEDFKERKKNIAKKRKKGQPHESIAIDIEKMLHSTEALKYKHQTRLN